MKGREDECSPVPNVGGLAGIPESDEHGVRSYELDGRHRAIGRLEWGLLAHSMDILALVDPQGTILYINHSAERIMTRSIERYMDAMEGGLPFDAVIMDLTIRDGMGSREAIAELLRLDPDAKVIVSSGYSDDAIMGRYAECGFSEVLPKPYGLKELGRMLAKVIGE